MKFINALILFSFLILLSSTVSAVPSPASTYCSKYGSLKVIQNETGQYNICIFENNECDEWAFYCKCGPNTEFYCSEERRGECNITCPENKCSSAGESSFVSVCCAGLKTIYPKEIYDDLCNRQLIGGWTSICSDCGNGECEEWESDCNCPQDCQKNIMPSQNSLLYTALLIVAAIILVLIVFKIRKK